MLTAPREFDDAGIIGQWTREQLEKMDSNFVAAMERAIKRGLEHLPGASRRVLPSHYKIGLSSLARGPCEPGDELQGGWPREQLLRMDDCFVVAVEAAFRSGLESPASASAVQRGTTTICSSMPPSSTAS